MKSAKKGMNVFLVLLALFFLLGGCSNNQKNIDEKSEITGSVIEDSNENCRLSNNSDCRPIEIRKGEQENEEAEEMNIAQETTTPINKPNQTINETQNKTQEAKPACEEGWKCVEEKYRAYQTKNCSWVSAEPCNFGCKGSLCNTAPICKSGSSKCEDGMVMKCSKYGSEWVQNETCEHGCQNGACILNQNTLISNNATNTTQHDFIADNCINISKYNLTGSNPTDEYFTLKNLCSYSIDLSKWTAKDNASNPHVYTFPSFNLAGNEEVAVVTGSGTNSQTTLYWGRNSAVWNNGGDTLYLNAHNGTNILTKVLTP